LPDQKAGQTEVRKRILWRNRVHSLVIEDQPIICGSRVQ
jgi:hypothetical protein